MQLEKLQDLSVYYFVKDLFAPYPFVTVVDEFPVADLIIPSIAVETQEIATKVLEIGTRKRLRLRNWYIDVFASNKNQRDEFGYLLLSAIEQDIPVYDYNMGFPPTITPTQLGALKVDDLRMEIIKVMPELTEKLYYRAIISFLAEYSLF